LGKKFHKPQFLPINTQQSTKKDKQQAIEIQWFKKILHNPGFGQHLVFIYEKPSRYAETEPGAEAGDKNTTTANTAA
jgi:hypothetical protein